ncbi:hypothetical protein TPA0909_66090 [Streptomyces albus]|nr:hypothetical protein TPA0909_66090 [Streptomyces albus]
MTFSASHGVIDVSFGLIDAVGALVASSGGYRAGRGLGGVGVELHAAAVAGRAPAHPAIVDGGCPVGVAQGADGHSDGFRGECAVRGGGVAVGKAGQQRVQELGRCGGGGSGVPEAFTDG